MFDTIKAQAGWLDAERCEGVTRINSNLKRPVGTFSLGGYLSRGAKAFVSPIATAVGNVRKSFEEAAQNAARSPQNQDASGVNDKTPTRAAEAQLAARSGNPQTEQQMEQNPQVSDATDEDGNIRQEQEANQAGWGSLMADLGFTGLGDIGHNLGYVIA